MDEENRSLDLSRWPIVYVDASRATSDEELLKSIVAYSRAIGEHLEAHVVCLTISNTASLSLSQRRIIGETWKPGPQNATPGCLGTAMVFESKLISGMLSAIFWISQPKYPTKTFTDMASAEIWITELLKDAPKYDQDDPKHFEMLRAMTTAGVRFAHKYSLADDDELKAVRLEAVERWPY
jgi:hypothetical protein